MSKSKLKNRIMIEKLKEFNYPDWAKYVSVDNDGEVYAYENEPTKDKDYDVWNAPGEVKLMGFLEDFDDSVVIEIENIKKSLIDDAEVVIPEHVLKSCKAALDNFARPNYTRLTEQELEEAKTEKPVLERINELISASEKPVWARYVAVDNDGDVFMYSDKPKFVGGMWRTTSPECDIVYVGDIDFPENNAQEHCYETEYDWKADLEKSYNVPKSVIDRIAALDKGLSIHNVFVVIKSVKDALEMHGLADDEEIVKSFDNGTPLIHSEDGWIEIPVESVKGMNEISVSELKEVLNAE